MADVSDLVLVLGPSLVTGAVAVVSAILVYRAGERSGERQLRSENNRLDREAERERERVAAERQGSTTSQRRARYERFLEAVHEVSSFLQQSAAASKTFAGQEADEGGLTYARISVPEPVPPEMLERLATGAAGAALDADNELAAAIDKIHEGLIEDAYALAKGWGHADRPGVINSNDLVAVRQMMREQLRLTG